MASIEDCVKGLRASLTTVEHLSKEEVASALDSIFEYSFDQIRDVVQGRKVGAEIPIPIAEGILNLRGSYSDSKSAYESIRTRMTSARSEDQRRVAMSEIYYSFATKEGLEKYKDCLEILSERSVSLTSEARNGDVIQVGVEFLVTFLYRQTDHSDPAETPIRSVRYTGVTPIQPLDLRDNVMAKAFVAIPQVFKRTSGERVQIIVSADEGVASIELEELSTRPSVIGTWAGNVVRKYQVSTPETQDLMLQFNENGSEVKFSLSGVVNNGLLLQGPKRDGPSLRVVNPSDIRKNAENNEMSLPSRPERFALDYQDASIRLVFLVERITQDVMSGTVFILDGFPPPIGIVATEYGPMRLDRQ